MPLISIVYFLIVHVNIVLVFRQCLQILLNNIFRVVHSFFVQVLFSQCYIIITFLSASNYPLYLNRGNSNNGTCKLDMKILIGTSFLLIPKFFPIRDVSYPRLHISSYLIYMSLHNAVNLVSWREVVSAYVTIYQLSFDKMYIK